MEFGRRVTVEKEIDNTESIPPSTAVFDESGNFVMYPTMLGIKRTLQSYTIANHCIVVNTYTNRVVKVLGKAEGSTRFLRMVLYQGKTKGSAVLETLQANAAPDPTLICTAFKKNRFYMFTRREPNVEE
jgi:peptidylprolyl isomerase domain and WD repeat-containing protein 1